MNNSTINQFNIIPFKFHETYYFILTNHTAFLRTLLMFLFTDASNIISIQQFVG